MQLRSVPEEDQGPGAGGGRELCPGEYLNVGVNLLVA